MIFDKNVQTCFVINLVRQTKHHTHYYYSISFCACASAFFLSSYFSIIYCFYLCLVSIVDLTSLLRNRLKVLILVKFLASLTQHEDWMWILCCGNWCTCDDSPFALYLRRRRSHRSIARLCLGRGGMRSFSDVNLMWQSLLSVSTCCRKDNSLLWALVIWFSVVLGPPPWVIYHYCFVAYYHQGVRMRLGTICCPELN